MANFAANLHTYKPSLSTLETELFPALHPFVQQDFNHNLQSFMGFSVDNLISNRMPELPGKSWENVAFQPSDCLADQGSMVMDGSGFHGINKKRKSEHLEESSSRNSSPPVSESGIRPRNVLGRGRRGRSKEKEAEEKKKKPKEVVHVRAKRGQATDSHSLAERVRRGKINEKLRCLQDMVPGCYKAMGMAVMLDEIINYVQSLQNQVEFLSMKLAAASALHDFNAQFDCIDNVQKAKAYEAQYADKSFSIQGYDQIQTALACSQSTWPLI